MRLSHLDDYRLRELSMGRENADRLLDEHHIIHNPAALYPEYELGDGVALHRPGVNLGALLFLHRRVLAYVPPMRSEEFPARFDVDYATFMELAYPADASHRFIFPILNHPRHYRRADVRGSLTDLLQQQPPTWERWHEALRVTNGTRWFDEADTALPTPAHSSTHCLGAFGSADSSSRCSRDQGRSRLLARDAPEGALLVLDEAQKVSGWSETLKSMWDQDTARARNLKVVLLGSALLLVQRGFTESLAGRFEVVRVPHWLRKSHAGRPTCATC